MALFAASQRENTHVSVDPVGTRAARSTRGRHSWRSAVWTLLAATVALLGALPPDVAFAQKPEMGDSIDAFLDHSIQLLENKQYEEFLRTSVSRNFLSILLQRERWDQLKSKGPSFGGSILRIPKMARQEVPRIGKDGTSVTLYRFDFDPRPEFVTSATVRLCYTGGKWYFDFWCVDQWEVSVVPAPPIDPNIAELFEDAARKRAQKEAEEKEKAIQALKRPLPGPVALTNEMESAAQALLDDAVTALEKKQFKKVYFDMLGRDMLIDLSGAYLYPLSRRAALYMDILRFAKHGTATYDADREEITFARKEGGRHAKVTLAYEAGRWYFVHISGGELKIDWQ